MADEERRAEVPEDETPQDEVLEDEGDVLLSEVEFGSSGPSASGTVIGMEGDLMVAGDSDIQLAGSGEPAGPEGGEVSGLDELDLTLEEDLSLIEEEKPVTTAGDSDIDLAGEAGFGADSADLFRRLDRCDRFPDPERLALASQIRDLETVLGDGSSAVVLRDADVDQVSFNYQPALKTLDESDFARLSPRTFRWHRDAEEQTRE